MRISAQVFVLLAAAVLCVSAVSTTTKPPKTTTAKSTKLSALPGDNRGKRTLPNFGNGYTYQSYYDRNYGQGYSTSRSYNPYDGTHYNTAISGSPQFTSNYLTPGHHQPHYPYHPYIEPPEPIIEIIIKDSNETLNHPPSPPQPIIHKKKKEKVHVYYVKYKKGEDNKLHLDEPIASLNNDESKFEEEEEIVEYPIVTPLPPLKATTLRTVIHPDSEQFHSTNRNVHVTFGSEDKSKVGHRIEEHNAESVRQSVVAVPVKSSYQKPPGNFVEPPRYQQLPQLRSRSSYQIPSGPPPPPQRQQEHYQQLPQQTLVNFRPPQQQFQQQRYQSQPSSPQTPQFNAKPFFASSFYQPQKEHQGQPQRPNVFFPTPPPTSQLLPYQNTGPQYQQPFNRPSQQPTPQPQHYQQFEKQHYQQAEKHVQQQQQQQHYQPQPEKHFQQQHYQPQPEKQQHYQPQPEKQPHYQPQPEKHVQQQHYQQPQHEKPHQPQPIPLNTEIVPPKPQQQHYVPPSPPLQPQYHQIQPQPQQSYQPQNHAQQQVQHHVQLEHHAQEQSQNQYQQHQIQQQAHNNQQQHPVQQHPIPEEHRQPQNQQFNYQEHQYQHYQPNLSVQPLQKENYNQFSQHPASDALTALHSKFNIQPSKQTELLKAIPKYEQHITETINVNPPSFERSHSQTINTNYSRPTGHFITTGRPQEITNYVTTPRTAFVPSPSSPAPHYVHSENGEQVQIVTPMPSTSIYNLEQQQRLLGSGKQPVIIPNSQPKPGYSSPYSVSTLYSDAFQELEQKKQQYSKDYVEIQSRHPPAPASQPQSAPSAPAAPSKPNVELPDEVPDDLRQQLLSSGILNNADISILDYDKVGDIALENLPQEHLQHFYGAGGGAQISESNRVLTVVKPNGDSVNISEKEVEAIKETGVLPKKNVELKVVKFDSANQKTITDKYVKDGATILPPVDLSSEKLYNKYLPVKVNGAQFPIPDVEELRGKTISNVVVLAPVDTDSSESRQERDVSKNLKFSESGDNLKALVKKPTRENFKKWLEAESKQDVEQQSVVLLVMKNPSDEQEIYMYDISNGSVSKLSGELSTAFVSVAEENASTENLENASLYEGEIMEKDNEKNTAAEQES